MFFLDIGQSNTLKNDIFCDFEISFTALKCMLKIKIKCNLIINAYDFLLTSLENFDISS